MMNYFVVGATASATTVESILEQTTTLVTKVISWMGQYMTFITENPLLFIPLLLTFAGLGVGMLFRIFKSM